MEDKILTVEHVSKLYRKKNLLGNRIIQETQAVKDVSFSVKRGRSLGLVGESGCGKTTVGKLVLNLIPADEGRILFEDIVIRDEKISLGKEKIRKLRRRMQMIFQDPAAALDPSMTVENLICEGLRAHGVCTRAEMRKKCVEALEKCGLSEAYLMRSPRELSGGEKQRVCIARAIAILPELIVCDEITASLDVSVQAQILDLLKNLNEDLGLTYLFITHNLELVKYICDDILIMYKGHVVETCSVQQLFANPIHPYSRLLLDSIPANDLSKRKTDHYEVSGMVETSSGVGCPYAKRCKNAEETCFYEMPKMMEWEKGHYAACIHPMIEIRKS